MSNPDEAGATDDVAPAQPEKRIEEWVYRGTAQMQSGPCYWFQLVDEGKLGRDYFYSVKTAKKNVGHLHIGAVYSVETDGHTVWFGTKRYLRIWHNEGDRAAWQARERAIEARESAERREARETKENALDELLRPLRREYQRTNWRGQLALELVVINALGKRITDEDT